MSECTNFAIRLWVMAFYFTDMITTCLLCFLKILSNCGAPTDEFVTLENLELKLKLLKIKYLLTYFTFFTCQIKSMLILMCVALVSALLLCCDKNKLAQGI